VLLIEDLLKSRDIDLPKKAFMEIAKNKGTGVMTVTIGF
jgi:rare lipoprotein A